jgi:hypothetical protein
LTAIIRRHFLKIAVRVTYLLTDHINYSSKAQSSVYFYRSLAVDATWPLARFIVKTLSPITVEDSRPRKIEFPSSGQEFPSRCRREFAAKPLNSWIDLRRAKQITGSNGEFSRFFSA